MIDIKACGVVNGLAMLRKFLLATKNHRSKLERQNYVFAMFIGFSGNLIRSRDSFFLRAVKLTPAITCALPYPINFVSSLATYRNNPNDGETFAENA